MKKPKNRIIYRGNFFPRWLIAILFFALGGGKWNTPVSVIVGAVIMVYASTIGTIIVQKLIYKEPLKP